MKLQSATYENPPIFFEYAQEKKDMREKMGLDYSTFGAPLPGRTFGSGDYRYGYNGQEKDDEVTANNGTTYSAEYWEYDARLGRRWNLDPVTNPEVSSYSVMLDNPIKNTDPEGNVVDLGEKGTREYRRNKRKHDKLYGNNDTYTKQYDKLNAEEETYHMRYSSRDGVSRLRKGGTTRREDGIMYWDYTEGMRGSIQMKPMHIEFRYLNWTRWKQVDGGEDFVEGKIEEHHDEHKLRRRVPNTEIKIDALTVPDFFIIKDENGNVLSGPDKLGGKGEYDDVLKNDDVYNPPGGVVIVQVDSYRNETLKKDCTTKDSPESFYHIYYWKYRIAIRFPVFVEGEKPK